MIGFSRTSMGRMLRAQVYPLHQAQSGTASARVDVNEITLEWPSVVITAAPSRASAFVLLNPDGSERQRFTVPAGQTLTQALGPSDPAAIERRTNGGAAGNKRHLAVPYRWEA